MIKKLFPFLFAGLALTIFGVLFATQRMGMIHPSLDRFMRRADLEPNLPEAEA